MAAEPEWRAKRLAEIWDRPATPAADLVAKQAQPAEVAAPYDARGHNPSTRLVSVRRRCDFDRVAIAAQRDNERCVIEVASLPMLARGLNSLEDPAVDADGMPTCAERNPIQINGGCP